MGALSALTRESHAFTFNDDGKTREKQDGNEKFEKVSGTHITYVNGAQTSYTERDTGERNITTGLAKCRCQKYCTAPYTVHFLRHKQLRRRQFITPSLIRADYTVKKCTTYSIDTVSIAIDN